MTPPRRAEELARKRTAIAGLYEGNFERVARYIAVRIRSMDEAEDLASEVFVRALGSVERYQDTGAPMEAWLFKIAHNLAVDHLRSKSRRPRLVPLDEDKPGAGTENPGEDLERQEERRELQQAMEQLAAQ